MAQEAFNEKHPGKDVSTMSFSQLKSVAPMYADKLMKGRSSRGASGGGQPKPMTEIQQTRQDAKNTALEVPGRGQARTEREAISFREAASSAENAKADLAKVKELGQGVTVFDRTKIGLIQQNLMTAIGKLRLSVLGPGVMTDSERAYLRENIGDPSILFSTEAIQNAKLDQLITQIDASIDRQADQVVVPKAESPDKNPEEVDAWGDDEVDAEYERILNAK